MKTRAQEMLFLPQRTVCHLYSGNFVNYMATGGVEAQRGMLLLPLLCV
jgi:hypothetical protein